MTVGRYFRTLRKLTPGQFGWRAVHELRLRAYRYAPAMPSLWYRPDFRARFSARSLDAAPLALLVREQATGELWRRGFVSYLNKTRPHHDWGDGSSSKLWRYERQYHAELVALVALAAADPAGGWLEDALRFFREWNAEFPPATGDAWEPYPVSRRILNWSLASVISPHLGAQLAPFLAMHLRFLADHLERHLLGNHLLCNAAALVAGAAILSGPGIDAFGDLGQCVMERELSRQILRDGGFAERTAQYHTVVLGDILLAIGLRRRREQRVSDSVLRAAASMACWLATIRRSNGCVPLINDAAPDAQPPVSEVLGLAAALEVYRGESDGWLRRAFGSTPSKDRNPIASGDIILPETGWTIIRETSHELLFEHGPIGPIEQPGHGHSDALSFELIWNNVPIVIDTGVTTYDRGSVRSFERSACAHATVSVDGGSADEVWASFRVGGHARVHAAIIERQKNVRLLRGETVAFRGWRHKRSLVYWPGIALVILDEVLGAPVDSRVISHIPLAPACSLEQGLITASGVSLALLILRGQLIEVEAGWTSGGFGRRQPRLSLSVGFDANKSCAYAFAVPGVQIELDRESCVIRLDDSTVSIRHG